MKTPNHFYKDIINGLLFIAGILGFMSGDFILSAVFLAVSAVMSNINFAQEV
jgi:hypothetical protein